MNTYLKLSVLSGLFLLFLLSTNPASASDYYATVRPSITNYYLNADGSVLVELVFSNVSGQSLEVPLEPGYDASTLYAVDSDGASLPVDLIDGNAIINVISSVEWVRFTYIINNSEVTDEVILKFTLRPQGKCTIYIPGEFLLLTYSGNPTISIIDETLLLEYENADVVVATLISLQPTTQTPTTAQQPETRNTHVTTAVIAALVAVILAVTLLYLRGRKHK